MSRTKMLRDGLFTVVTAAALGFGATQVQAAPQERQPAGRICTDANHAFCDDWCVRQGADSGYCSSAGCRCHWL